MLTAFSFATAIPSSRQKIPLGERHLSKVLAEWVRRYNQGRPHSSLGPGIPEPVEMLLPTQPHIRYFSTDIPKVVARPILGGLHHEYRWERVAARKTDC
jgi:putative transposase